MIRSILAVVAGLAVLTVVSFTIEAAADPLLIYLFPHALSDAAALARNFPARLFMLAYTTFSIVVGGYVTAWIARRAQLTHAAIMGAIEVAFTLYVMIAAPFSEVHHTSRWSWVAGMILMIPAACLGAAIRSKQESAPRRPAALTEINNEVAEALLIPDYGDCQDRTLPRGAQPSRQRQSDPVSFADGGKKGIWK